MGTSSNSAAPAAGALQRRGAVEWLHMRPGEGIWLLRRHLDGSERLVPGHLRPLRLRRLPCSWRGPAGRAVPDCRVRTSAGLFSVGFAAVVLYVYKRQATRPPACCILCHGIPLSPCSQLPKCKAQHQSKTQLAACISWAVGPPAPVRMRLRSVIIPTTPSDDRATERRGGIVR